MELEVLEHYLGPISELLKSSDITEIMVNRWNEVFIERSGVFERVDVSFSSDHEVALLIGQVASSSGGAEATVDRDPVVNARLPDGSRFCGVLSPWSVKGSMFSIRKFPDELLTIKDLVSKGSLTDEMSEYLQDEMRHRKNVIVSGSTSSGKTTVVNALGAFIDPNERVVTVEDTEELKFEHVKNWVPLVSHNRVMDVGAQEVGLSSFITTALRLNPDRIFVGEIRESSAAIAFIRGINTGHDGCVTTIHANSPLDAMYRLIGEVSASGVPMAFAEQQVWRNVNLVIQVKKLPAVGRRVTAISQIDDGIVRDVFVFDEGLGRHVRCST